MKSAFSWQITMECMQEGSTSKKSDQIILVNNEKPDALFGKSICRSISISGT
jgi:hypothetical protein